MDVSQSMSLLVLYLFITLFLHLKSHFNLVFKYDGDRMLFSCQRQETAIIITGDSDSRCPPQVAERIAPGSEGRLPGFQRRDELAGPLSQRLLSKWLLLHRLLQLASFFCITARHDFTLQLLFSNFLLLLSPQMGDKNLAQNAQMYHYQHQKQQMLSMGKYVSFWFFSSLADTSFLSSFSCLSCINADFKCSTTSSDIFQLFFILTVFFPCLAVTNLNRKPLTPRSHQMRKKWVETSQYMSALDLHR